LLESLATVLENGLATASDRQRRLIQYLVTEELEGRGDRLKAISIATDVLGRSADFNPQTDSIVRVEMGRIRQTLELYYATLGQNDPVQIKFEKRGSGGACGWSQRRFWSQCLPAAHFGFFPIWQDPH
jgi:adenylate cyclase